MPNGELFDADADDTEEALMAATYRALCEHGYADLTIQQIGEEFEKSPSLLYHHYDGKDELLVAFLDYMIERFEAEVPFEETAGSWEALRHVLDHVLAPDPAPDRRDSTSALVELRAQATHDPAYRAAFTRHDEFFHDRLATVLRDGIDAGEFRAVDPEQVASLVQATLLGAMSQRATTEAGGGSDTAAVRQELEAMLDVRLRGGPENDPLEVGE